jgi:hypothetical protein
MLVPGASATVTVGMLLQLQMGTGEPFELFEGDRMVGVGVVRQLG